MMQKDNGYSTDTEITFFSSFSYNDLMNKELFQDEVSIQQLVKKAEEYVQGVERDDFNRISARREKVFTTMEARYFFRHFERHQNNVFVLQYLISFIGHLPESVDIREGEANPFAEFKSFLQFNVDLLTQDDVIDSILRVARDDGLSTESKLAYFRWRTFKTNRELTSLLKDANAIGRSGWKKLFTVIQQICLFWFSIRSRDLRLIRSADMFMFLISRVLINRLNAQ